MPSNIRPYYKPGRGDEDATHLAHQALQFIRLCYRWDASRTTSPFLHAITLYPPNHRHNGDWLVVGKGYSGDTRMVAFHRSSHPFKALLGFLSKVAAQTIEWKEDSYAQTTLEWLKR